MRIPIYEPIWLRGKEAFEEPYLIHPSNKKADVLAQYLQAVGVPADMLVAKRFPSQVLTKDIRRHFSSEHVAWLVSSATSDTAVATDIIAVNDDPSIEDDARKSKLRKLFLDNTGIELHFSAENRSASTTDNIERSIEMRKGRVNIGIRRFEFNSSYDLYYESAAGHLYTPNEMILLARGELSRRDFRGLHFAMKRHAQPRAALVLLQYSNSTRRDPFFALQGVEYYPRRPANDRFITPWGQDIMASDLIELLGQVAVAEGYGYVWFGQMREKFEYWRRTYDSDTETFVYPSAQPVVSPVDTAGVMAVDLSFDPDDPGAGTGV